MNIGLHDAEKDYLKHKSFPNYALMKISAWHKAHGDKVEWWNPLYKYDQVYSSKIFDFTPVDPYLPYDAIKGGTGYVDLPVNNTLPDEIDNMFPDYSIYPECDYAIGYITRGCPNNCRWCIVPQKEGKIRPYRIWEELVRKDTEKLVLMDNNILACEYGVSQLEGMIGSGYKIDLNQGMDARLVNSKVAHILAQLRWIRYIRFSCDQKSQIEPVRHAIELLAEHGIKPYKIFVYLLVTSNLEDASERVEMLKKYKGISLYAQAERNERLGILPNRMQLEFQQRYVYGGCYRKETWKEYCKRKGLIF
ncbi:radical SAM protein [Parablautia intestinalis]|uniref:Radical SAM protein n=1 Tax=Parablautia intestinalis TaxID=2320100 RepID=A0A3A9AGD8_9FIRM|nr:radical SAM protein [Parablautia intestinalis]RKI90457.1 radical SAM protein [Parablautia intestinalis]